MDWISSNIAAILVISGLATVSMGYQALAPARALRQSFGTEVSDPMALWQASQNGVVVAALGFLLIAAAFDPGVRAAAVATVGATKLVFAARVLLGDSRWRGKPITMAAVADLAMVAVFAAYLIA